MRVIAGKYKGRIFLLPKNIGIRATKDMVKKALFDILGAKIENASFLELFAGSGNVGIEALSRGALEVFFVENNRLCVRTIIQNLKQLNVLYRYGLAEQQEQKDIHVTILPWEVEQAMEVLQQRKYKFDFVFLDPPYFQEQMKKALKKPHLYDILKPHSWIIAEQSKRDNLPNELEQLKLMLTRKYGDTLVSFYQARTKR